MPRCGLDCCPGSGYFALHIERKAKPVAKWGRKATDLSKTAGLPTEGSPAFFWGRPENICTGYQGRHCLNINQVTRVPIEEEEKNMAKLPNFSRKVPRLVYLSFSAALVVGCLAILLDGAVKVSFALTGVDCVGCHDGNGSPGPSNPSNIYNPDLEPDGTMVNEHHYWVFDRVRHSCYDCHKKTTTQTIGICVNCHYTGSAYGRKFPAKDADQAHRPFHDRVGVPQEFCLNCHAGNVYDEHRQRSLFADNEGDMNCALCHDSSIPEVQDTIDVASGEYGEQVFCDNCHVNMTGVDSHAEQHDNVLLDSSGCLECHAANIVDEHLNRGWTCSTCHGGETATLDPLVVQEVIANGSSPNNQQQGCLDCHIPEDWKQTHQYTAHSTTPGSGTVALFADTDHDDAGWRGEKPYFAVSVDCSTCHVNDLRNIHANDCFTCHTTPYYISLQGNWQGGCQQGACHTVYHADSTTAHLPWENAYNDSGNDCTTCHDQYSWEVQQTNCLNCHAAPWDGYNIKPETFADVMDSYIGPAWIKFSIRAKNNNDTVRIGRTYYRLDDGPEAGAMELFVTTPGSHVLEYWSIDQAGSVENPHKTTTFTIIADEEPPTTVSNARDIYSQGAWISLSATDNSTLGVKETYYSINGGPTRSGTTVYIPPTSGTLDYTLTFWSEDWAGNAEPGQQADFTVTSGTGTLRLVWWDSDLNGSPCTNDPEASASWTIRRDSWWGPVVATGSGGCPNWSGVDDVAVQVGPRPYFVRIDWWDSYYGYDDQTDFANISVTKPGQVVRLNY